MSVREWEEVQEMSWEECVRDSPHLRLLILHTISFDVHPQSPPDSVGARHLCRPPRARAERNPDPRVHAGSSWLRRTPRYVRLPFVRLRAGSGLLGATSVREKGRAPLRTCGATGANRGRPFSLGATNGRSRGRSRGRSSATPLHRYFVLYWLPICHPPRSSATARSWRR